MSHILGGNFGGAIGLGYGGEIEESLSPSDNAKKELIEETGYQGNIEIVESYIFEKGNFKYYNFIGIVDEEFKLDNSEVEHVEVDEILWLSIDALLIKEDLHFGIQSLLDNSLEQIQNIISK